MQNVHVRQDNTREEGVSLGKPRLPSRRAEPQHFSIFSIPLYLCLQLSTWNDQLRRRNTHRAGACF